MFSIALLTLSVCLLIIWSVWRLTYPWRRSLHMTIFSVYVAHNSTTLYDPLMGDQKRCLFKDLHQAAQKKATPLKVIEIGSGSGPNFKYFPDGLDLTCFEPNPKFEPYVRENADLYLSKSKFRLVNERVEDLAEFADNSIDAVICTLVLCSVEDQAQLLATSRRVLKPVRMRAFWEIIYCLMCLI